MRKPTTLLMLTATLAAALTGCGGGGDGHSRDEGAPTVRGDVQTSAPSGSPAAAVTAKAGQSQTERADGYEVVATVYSYKQPLPSQETTSRAGYVFAGMDVRMCVKASPDARPVSISANPWSLSYTDDTRIEPEFADSDSFSIPLYPQDSKAIAVGDCVRGWVVFAVPRSKRPTQALYTVEDATGPVAPLRWTIG